MSKQLEKWPLPEEIFTDEYRCVILRIPDKPEYVTAFYDAYDMLCRWLSWEKRGDTSARDAGLLFRKYQPLWVDCEIPDAIDEETGDMAINVNVTTKCNCGCEINTGPQLPTLVDPSTGEEIEVVCLPVDPNDPLGESDLPEPDYEAEQPPPGWDDWQEFVDNQCLMANYSADMLLASIGVLDEIENQSSVGRTILDIASIIILLLPLPLGKVGGLKKIAVWVSKLAAAIGLAADLLEPLNDWLQVFADEIAGYRDEIVCLMYLASDPTVTVNGVVNIMDDILSGLVGQGLPQPISDALRDVAVQVTEDVVPLAAQKAINLLIPEGYQATKNCLECLSQELDNGWQLIPLTLNNDLTPHVIATTGVSGHSATTVGQYIRHRATADAANRRSTTGLVLNCELAAGKWSYGWLLETSGGVNTSANGVRNAGEPPPYFDLNEANSEDTPPRLLICVRDSYVAQFNAESGMTANFNPASPPARFQAQAGTDYIMVVGDRSVAAGEFGSDVRVFLICRDDMLGS